MSYITQAQVAPWIISNDAAALAGAATTVLVGNSVYLYAFDLLTSAIITGAKWRMGATVSGTDSTTDIGIYDANGNLLGHTGATANTASTNMSQALTGGNLLLPAGRYFMALTPGNSSDTYLGITSSASLTSPSRNRIATNGSTLHVGVLPSTTGGYSDAPSRIAAMSLTISGGLT